MDKARQWLTSAPFASAQPFAFDSTGGSTAEGSLTDRAEPLTVLQLDAKGALAGRQSCAPLLSRERAG
jgi:hypothetical protein